MALVENYSNKLFYEITQKNKTKKNNSFVRR